MTQEELDKMQKLALEQLMTGQSLTGKDGVFAPMLKQFLEASLEAEMEGHLDKAERIKKNKRNGRGRKTLKTNVGEVEIITPQDRHSSFEPQIIRIRETVLAESLTGKILSLYGMGVSLRDISKHIRRDVRYKSLSDDTKPNNRQSNT